MEAKIKQQLPGTLQVLVDEIETAAGVEIEVGQVAAIAGLLPGRYGGAAPTPMQATLCFGADAKNAQGIRLMVNHTGDIAACQRPYTVPYAGFCHELMHLRRYVVDRVPIIVTAPEPVKLPRAAVENMLEHQVIERQHRQYGFDFPLHTVARQAWDTFVQAEVGTCNLAILQVWTETQLLNDADVGEEVRQAAEVAMERAGLLSLLRAFSDNVAWLAKSPDVVAAKQAMVALVYAFFGQPVGDVLMFHRSSTGEWTNKRLPRQIRLRATARGEMKVFQWRAG
jgi:hypothetical protein